MLRYLYIFIILTLSISSQEKKIKGTETIPISKTMFKLIKKNGDKIVNLKDKNFILVSVREEGSEGRFYAVDRDATVWWSGIISSGAENFRTPSGIFSIFQKKRYHMSTEFPDENLSNNNMNYMMKFTKNGHALHEGNVSGMSHGCIHIHPKDVPAIYKWSTFRTKVIITRHKYMPFVIEDFQRIY